MPQTNPKTIIIKPENDVRLKFNPGDKTGDLTLKLSRAQLDSALVGLEPKKMTAMRVVSAVSKDQQNPFKASELNKALKEDRSHRVDKLSDLKNLQVRIRDENGRTYTLKDLERIVREKGIKPEDMEDRPIVLQDESYKLAVDESGKAEMEVRLTDHQLRQALDAAAEPGDITPLQFLKKLSKGKDAQFSLTEVNKRLRQDKTHQINSLEDAQQIQVNIVDPEKNKKIHSVQEMEPRRVPERLHGVAEPAVAFKEPWQMTQGEFEKMAERGGYAYTTSEEAIQAVSEGRKPIAQITGDEVRVAQEQGLVVRKIPVYKDMPNDLEVFGAYRQGNEAALNRLDSVLVKMGEIRKSNPSNLGPVERADLMLLRVEEGRALGYSEADMMRYLRDNFSHEEVVRQAMVEGKPVPKKILDEHSLTVKEDMVDGRDPSRTQPQKRVATGVRTETVDGIPFTWVDGDYGLKVSARIPQHPRRRITNKPIPEQVRDITRETKLLEESQKYAVDNILGNLNSDDQAVRSKAVQDIIKRTGNFLRPEDFNGARFYQREPKDPYSGTIVFEDKAWFKGLSERIAAQGFGGKTMAGTVMPLSVNLQEAGVGYGQNTIPVGVGVTADLDEHEARHKRFNLMRRGVYEKPLTGKAQFNELALNELSAHQGELRKGVHPKFVKTGLMAQIGTINARDRIFSDSELFNFVKQVNSSVDTVTRLHEMGLSNDVVEQILVHSKGVGSFQANWGKLTPEMLTSVGQKAAKSTPEKTSPAVDAKPPKAKVATEAESIARPKAPVVEVSPDVRPIPLEKFRLEEIVWNAYTDKTIPREVVVNTADKLVDLQKDWVSTREYPAPSALPNMGRGHELHDLAAVLAGKKLAATLPVAENPITAELLKRAKAKGLHVEKAVSYEYVETGKPLTWDYIVGDKKTVKEIIELRKQTCSAARDMAFGEKIGYHPDAIKDYVRMRQERGDYAKRGKSAPKVPESSMAKWRELSRRPVFKTPAHLAGYALLFSATDLAKTAVDEPMETMYRAPATVATTAGALTGFAIVDRVALSMGIPAGQVFMGVAAPVGIVSSAIRTGESVSDERVSDLQLKVSAGATVVEGSVLGAMGAGAIGGSEFGPFGAAFGAGLATGATMARAFHEPHRIRLAGEEKRRMLGVQQTIDNATRGFVKPEGMRSNPLTEDAKKYIEKAGQAHFQETFVNKLREENLLANGKESLDANEVKRLGKLLTHRDTVLKHNLKVSEGFLAREKAEAKELDLKITGGVERAQEARRKDLVALEDNEEELGELLGFKRGEISAYRRLRDADKRFKSFPDSVKSIPDRFETAFDERRHLEKSLEDLYGRGLQVEYHGPAEKPDVKGSDLIEFNREFVAGKKSGKIETVTDEEEFIKKRIPTIDAVLGDGSDQGLFVRSREDVEKNLAILDSKTSGAPAIFKSDYVTGKLDQLHEERRMAKDLVNEIVVGNLPPEKQAEWRDYAEGRRKPTQKQWQELLREASENAEKTLMESKKAG